MNEDFTLRDLINEYGTNLQCLEALKQARWGELIPCRTCERETRHHYRDSHKSYSCQYCGTMISPTKDTILEGTKRPLFDWFYVIFQMSKTKTGFPAKKIQRELGCSYPTALRMCNLIRSCLDEPVEQLSGQVEADETYMGNSSRYLRGKRPRGRGTLKSPVVGVVERGGKIAAAVVENTKRETVLPFVEKNVAHFDEDGEPTEICTDEYPVYNTLDEHGYLHDSVCHSAREYVKYRKEIREDGHYETTEVHTNTLEGFWISQGGAKGRPPGRLREVPAGLSRRIHVPLQPPQ